MELETFLMLTVVNGVGVYLLLDQAILHVLLGIVIFSNGINLALLLTSGNPEGRAAPIFEGHPMVPMVDPLPQALILTAIVIGFGLVSFFSVFLYRFFKIPQDETKGGH